MLFQIVLTLALMAGSFFIPVWIGQWFVPDKHDGIQWCAGAAVLIFLAVLLVFFIVMFELAGVLLGRFTPWY